ncbi:MAG TPA: 3-phosphoshikimate 1-carboxyvinyltransferase, partial [Phycisphaerae bacterium]|nr:3-phosphoshikimate 1-carboxyvinyltransferase [Phycisphaerae bacterium]
AVLAAFADSPTTLRNLGSLRVKETDRLHALATELSRMGVRAEVSGDDLSISPSGRPHGAAIDTYDDHRMAMSFALAGLVTENVVIKDPGCVQKTFPAFFQLWATLGNKAG